MGKPKKTMNPALDGYDVSAPYNGGICEYTGRPYNLHTITEPEIQALVERGCKYFKKKATKPAKPDKKNPEETEG